MKFLTVVAAIAMLIVGAGQAKAVPAFCTGSITKVASGDFISGSSLVGTGNCVEASDKIFGAFAVGGAITGGGSAGWLFTMATGPADVTIGFQGLVGPSTTGNVDYKVEVDPGLSSGALISALEKDFTLNVLGAGATATLTGTSVTPAPVSFTGGDISTGFQCTRTAAISTCPQTGNFDPLTADLSVDQTIKTGPDTNVTAITDTVFQAVGEPNTLALLGPGLLGLFFVLWRRDRGSFSAA